MKIALIGYGAIAQMIVEAHGRGELAATIGAVLVRETYLEATRAAFGAETAVVTDAPGVIAARPDLVVECAGQGSVEQYGPDLLAAGLDLMIIATGAFADAAIRARLEAAAEAGGARMFLPAGAIAGIDGLGALSAGGLKSVTYTSTKPSHAWRGTPGEKNFDLESLTEPTVLYEGPADQAARLYPKNANIAATVALAGMGFADTIVRLVADPGAVINRGQIDAVGRFGHMTLEMRGQPMPDNPKTSAVTALSMIRAINNATARVVI